MRRILIVLALGLSFCLCGDPACAQALETGDQPTAANLAYRVVPTPWGTSGVTLSAGYRTDTLRWNIAGNSQGTDPNIRSELAWSDVEIYQLKLANRTVINEHFYLRAFLDYGWVIDGDNRDSDYAADDRNQEFSRSVNGVDGNRVWDGSIGIGPRWTFFNSALAICPLIGYGMAEQDFNIVDGRQTLSSSSGSAPLGPIAGLDSRYETRWQGPWVGVDISFSKAIQAGPFTTLEMLFSGEYHWVDYEADANWNLRSDYRHPVSFSHDAEGHGVVAMASVALETKNHWGIQLGMRATRMTTDAGTDRTFYADGTIGETQLNAVKWRSLSIEAGLCYRF